VPRIELRERRDGDLEGCVRALRLVHRADGYPMVWPRDPAGWLRPAATLQAWVAVTCTEHAGALVGHVLLLATQDPDTVEIARLFVSPEARGQGLGAALLGRARGWAEERDRQVVLQVVADERSHAIALYEREGWRRTGTVTAEWTAPDGRCVEVHSYAC
jgi:GNAT superfamily N-acetyltransferase